MNINYQSDFKIEEHRVDGHSMSAVPFNFSYYVRSGKRHEVSYDGDSYKGCFPMDDGGLTVVFDHKLLGIGELSVKREWHVPDKSFSDGKFDVVSNEKTGIFLVRGATDCTVVKLDVVVPFAHVDPEPDIPAVSVVDGVLYLSGSVSNNILSLAYGSVINNILSFTETPEPEPDPKPEPPVVSVVDGILLMSGVMSDRVMSIEYGSVTNNVLNL